jgi:hypothetical protein
MFLLFALGGTNVVNTAPKAGANGLDLSANPSKIMYISLVFGMALAVNAWVFFRINGGGSHRLRARRSGDRITDHRWHRCSWRCVCYDAK